MHEKENILNILKETKIALEKEDATTMKHLSDQTIHTASIYQDPDNIVIAVLVYSLSKITERRTYRRYKSWKEFMKRYTTCIDNSITSLEKDNESAFRKEMKHIRKHIKSLSGDFKKQIQEVFRRAEVNKASRIYEHGISMQRTADLLGVSVWELAEYTGGTGISEVKLNITLAEKERIKLAQEIFA